jgi:hypothetical protein
MVLGDVQTSMMIKKTVTVTSETEIVAMVGSLRSSVQQ